MYFNEDQYSIELITGALEQKFKKIENCRYKDLLIVHFFNTFFKIL